jgi:integrase
MPYLQLRAGFWRVRMPIPKHLQAIIGRGSRLTRALHTADREQADRLSLPVVAEFMDIIAAAEAKANWSTLMAEAAERAAKIAKFPWFRLNAPEAILRGLMNPETGEWLSQPFDFLNVPQPAAAPSERVSMSDLLALWIGERKPPPRSQVAYRGKVNRLVDFLGHDDAGKISERDMIRYKEHLLKDPALSQKTVAGHLDDLRTIFRFGAKNKKIPSDPLADVTFKPKRDPHKKRLPFSADDRRLILNEARGADPLIRWTAWVGAFSGMRLGEIVDAHTRDVMQLEGHWVFRIGVEHRETSIKTETSLRDVPIHSAVIREGFLDYVGALGSGPLFPMITPDRHGKRSDNASAIVNPWMRSIGITDRRKTFHSHRHTVKTLLRGQRVPEDVNDHITGHANEKVGRSYGAYPIPVLAEAIELLPVA